jgi:hypothetical protein
MERSADFISALVRRIARRESLSFTAGSGVRGARGVILPHLPLYCNAWHDGRLQYSTPDHLHETTFPPGHSISCKVNLKGYAEDCHSMSTIEKTARQPVFLVVLLLIASLAADIAVCAMARDQESPAPAVVFMLALSFSQVSLLALFVGLGTAPWLERLAALGAGIAFWVWMLEVKEDVPRDWVATFLSLHAAAVVVPARLVRLAGLRWTDELPPICAPASVPRQRQLTLTSLFGWTTLVAIVAALARHANLPSNTEASARMAFLLTNSALTTFAAAYAVFSSRHTAWCMAGAIMFVCVASVGFPSREQALFPLNVLHLLLVATALAVCRTAGLRMIRLGS